MENKAKSIIQRTAFDDNDLFIEEQIQVELYYTIYERLLSQHRLESVKGSEISFSIQEMTKIANCGTSTAYVAIGILKEAGLIEFENNKIKIV